MSTESPVSTACLLSSLCLAPPLLGKEAPPVVKLRSRKNSVAAAFDFGKCDRAWVMGAQRSPSRFRTESIER